MKIKLLKHFKSLEPFESGELSDFVVITGKNGSGKSQLIQLISKNESEFIKINPEVKRIQVEGMDFKRQAIVNHDNWRSKIDTQWNAYARTSPPRRRILKYILDNNINSRENFIEFFTADVQEKVIEEFAHDISREGGVQNFSPPDYMNRVQYLGSLLFSDGISNLVFFEKIALYNNKTIEDLQQKDFYKTPLEEHFIDNSELFSSEIAIVFYNYVKRWDQNARDWFDKRENAQVNFSISEEEFIKKYPKPWEMVNRILVEHDMDFEFVQLERSNFDRDVPITVKLKKVSSQTEIAFEDLSSGEKVIMALITKLFTSEYYGKYLKFPELLVLDEPDATLHPEMSKLLLDVLEKTFVQNFGIKIILTTHSPSTVALAPEESIYQLKNGNGSSLQHITKDEALAILTSFLPTLSIGYQNQRQVFVESPTDVAYFQMIHDKLYQNGEKNYRLYFISNAMGKGNSDLVYKTTESMRNAGNKSVFGIVDWDKKNTPKDAVLVHAKEVAYSIENIVVDPIYLMMLFASLGTGAFNVYDIIKKDQNYNHYLLGNESQEDLQKIADVIFDKLRAAFPNLGKDDLKREVKYFNGKSLKYPMWYLDMIGHELVPKFAKIFPGLSGKYPNEGDLQKALVPVIGKAFPFVPLTSVELLEKIEKA